MVKRSLFRRSSITQETCKTNVVVYDNTYRANQWIGYFAAQHGNRLGRIMVRFTRGCDASVHTSVPLIYSHIVLYSDKLSLMNG